MLQRRQALQLGGCLWLRGWEGMVHGSPSGQQTGCVLQCLVAFCSILSVCAAGLPSLKSEEQACMSLTGCLALGATMTSGHLFTAYLVMEEEPVF